MMYLQIVEKFLLFFATEGERGERQRKVLRVVKTLYAQLISGAII